MFARLFLSPIRSILHFFYEPQYEPKAPAIQKIHDEIFVDELFPYLELRDILNLREVYLIMTIVLNTKLIMYALGMQVVLRSDPLWCCMEETSARLISTHSASTSITTTQLRLPVSKRSRGSSHSGTILGTQLGKKRRRPGDMVV